MRAPMPRAILDARHAPAPPSPVATDEGGAGEGVCFLTMGVVFGVPEAKTVC